MAVIASVVLAFALISISRIKDCAITLRRVGKGGGGGAEIERGAVCKIHDCSGPGRITCHSL